MSQILPKRFAALSLMGLTLPAFALQATDAGLPSGSRPLEHKPYEALTPTMSPAVFDQYHVKALHGDPVAMDIVVFAMAKGCGRRIDSAAADKLCEKAAALGGPFSLLVMGTGAVAGEEQLGYLKRAQAAIQAMKPPPGAMVWYIDAMCKVRSGQHAAGVQALQQLAQQGNPWAQEKVGRWYLHEAYGLPLDYAKASSWLHKAAEQQVVQSYYPLATLYLNGWGVARDHQKFGEWVTKAAERGDCEAEWIALNFQGEKGFEARLKAAQAGLHHAMHTVAIDYMQGNGVAKSEAESFQWSNRLAEKGCPFGMRNTGMALAKGWGVPLDWDAGVALLIRGQEKYALDPILGLECMLLLHDLHRIPGPHQDAVKAKEWKDRAFAHKEDVAESLFDLGQSFGKGWALRKSADEAVKWYTMGTGLDHPGCQYKLARCYEFGWAVPKDSEKAGQLYEKAAKKDWIRGGTPLEKPVQREKVFEEF